MSFSSMQDQFVRIRSNKVFETFVILVIVASALVIGAKTYHINPTLARVFEVPE